MSDGTAPTTDDGVRRLQENSVAVARDAIALTLSVERLLVRVQELTDERDLALSARNHLSERESVERDKRKRAESRVQEAERALRDWGSHKTWCNVYDIAGNCNCGFGAVLGGDGQQEGSADSPSGKSA